MPHPRAKENRDRLPKWAKHLIEKLERDVAHYKADARAAASAGAGAPITLEIGGEEPLGLPDENIRFHPDPDNRAAWIEVRLLKGSIEVYAADTLSIDPRSTNVVEVKLRGRPKL